MLSNFLSWDNKKLIHVFCGFALWDAWCITSLMWFDIQFPWITYTDLLGNTGDN